MGVEELERPFESEVRVGLRMRAEWFWQRPLPGLLDVRSKLDLA